jgi:hypothetical protein
MVNDPPVVFLAFANAPDAHLENLKTESRRVFRTLQPLQDAGQIQVHREESSEIGELYEDLLRHDGRIVIFHYGGHADGNTLRLEGGDGGGEGMADLLGQQSGLKLVFLNGCATKGHVKRLLDAGVPAVIATSVPIGDVKAQEFANAFYIALAEGRSVAEAFDLGSAFVQSQQGAGGDAGVVFTRSGTDWEDEDEEEYDAPLLEWRLYVQESCAADLEQWRLPQAQSAWEILLTDTDGPLRTLDGSPCLLQYQAPSRTLGALVCANCGTTVTAAAETVSCAICGSNDVQAGSVPTQVADQVVPFSVSEDDARRQVLEYAGGDSKVIQITRVFVPYWIFDLETHTTLEAERGINRDFTAVPPKLEWEPVKDEIDLAFDTYLVPASSAPVGSDSTVQNWYWELDTAEPLERIDTATASIPLDRSMQSAFDQMASKQHRELEHEIADRVGGNHQRNVLTDTRYRNVAARTILLPHWYVTAEVDKGQAGLLVSGQTGAVRPLHLPGAVSLKNGSSTSMNKRTYNPGDEPAATSLAASVFAGIGIGLMVGLLLGLANPPLGEGAPIVAIFIGAVGAALAALLGVNDRHFSTAKALRIGAFGIAVIIAAPSGIFIRDHALLAPDLPTPPSLADRKKELLDLGYKPNVALNMLQAQIETEGDGSKFLVAAGAGRGGLHATPTSAGTCENLAAQTAWQESKFTAADIIMSVGAFVKDDDSTAMSVDEKKWMPLLDAAASERVSGQSQKNLVLIARDADCGLSEFKDQKILPSEARCQEFTGDAEQSIESILSPDEWKRVLGRVEGENGIKLPEERLFAYRKLGEFLCR